MYCLKNVLFFDIPLLYYYINLRSSKIFCLSSRDIYLCVCISLSCSFVTVSELFCVDFFLSSCNSVSNFITNQITRCLCCFWVTLFELVLSAPVADYLAWSRSFWLYLPLKFLPIFLAKHKNPKPFTNIWSLGWIE